MRYVVFEDATRPLAVTDTLVAAFAEVLTRAQRQAVWGRRPSGEITLQFRHATGPLRGEIVGAQTGEPETYAAPSGGGQEFARRLMMAELVKSGLCGYYACKEADLHRVNGDTEALAEKLRRVSTP
ncbi:MAG TPA: hypothetical protein VGG10_09485 [Rhizomicrobium sp.]